MAVQGLRGSHAALAEAVARRQNSPCEVIAAGATFLGRV